MTPKCGSLPRDAGDLVGLHAGEADEAGGMFTRSIKIVQFSCSVYF